MFLSRKGKAVLFAFYLLFTLAPACPSAAVDLEPYPDYGFSRDDVDFSLFREERPSFYWTSAGVPDYFFNGVNQISASPGPSIYTFRNIEYGVKSRVWLTDQLQLRATMPFEANALVDPNGNTHNAAGFGDAELAATFLLAGKREKGNFFGIDGRYRFATGTSPFQTAYPLLATGKGAPTETIGIIMGQELGGFSFFQSIHYEKTQPLSLSVATPYLGAGVFQWPDQLHALARVEYQVFHRVQRSVSLYYEMRFRWSGLMEFNNQALTYGLEGQTTDQLFFSNFGIIARVDREFSAVGEFSYFPYELAAGVVRPNYGWLFSLSMVFRPI